jgi:hypothetical protein
MVSFRAARGAEAKQKATAAPDRVAGFLRRNVMLACRRPGGEDHITARPSGLGYKNQVWHRMVLGLARRNGVNARQVQVGAFSYQWGNWARIGKSGKMDPVRPDRYHGLYRY